MALGEVTNSVTSGNGSTGAGASQKSRTVIAVGPCTLGTVNSLNNLSSVAAITSGLDTGALADYCAKLLQHGAPQVYAVPVNPSSAGALSASVTQTGAGAGTCTPSIVPHKQITVYCTTGGALATMKVKFSLDGGSTYSAEYTSAAGWATTGILVPGTYVYLTFGAATYVATKTNTIGVDGTVTPGSGWVGTVAILSASSSPIDNYNVKVTIPIAGVLGTATCNVSLDGGITSLPNMAIPSGGVVPIAGTGIALTFNNNSSTFTTDNTFSFKATGPGYSTSDVTAALTAIRTLPTCPTVALIHLIGLPASAAGAISAGSTLASAIDTARATYGKQWYGLVECPSASAGDTVVSGGAAIVDSADTDSVIRTARLSATATNYVSMCTATQEQIGAVNAWALRRPIGWGLAARMVEADPSSDPSRVGAGGLDFYLPSGALRRDEWASSTTLYDAQINVLRTMPTRAGAYLAIESGGFGWRNMTVDPNFQDANMVRVLCVFLDAITNAGQRYLGTRQATNADGTIREDARRVISGDLRSTARSTVGIDAGGSFVTPQASSADATVLASSQLGNSPYRLDVAYVLQRLGYVSSVKNNVLFTGTLTLQ